MKKSLVILGSLMVVLTFAASGFSKQMGKRNISQEEDYASRVSSFYLGTWTGTFEHLYLTHPKLTATVNLKSLKLSRSWIRLKDEAPSGEVLIALGDKVEKFKITEVEFDHAYKFANDDNQQKNPIESPEESRIYISFENGQKRSGISFSEKGLFKLSYSQAALGEEAYGTVSKQETK
ncbi:MAG: hypothetical protein HYY62_08515 [Deltaproteobacteria bacterium]|nr:hypothetical protein [Deltaproteobacteria bacterium]